MVTVKQSSKNIYHNNCKLSNVYAHRLATLLCPPDGNEIIYRLAMLLNVIEHGKKMQLLQAANAEIYMNWHKTETQKFTSFMRKISC